MIKFFEVGLWYARFLVFFAIISSLIASIVLFIIGSIDIFQVIKQTWLYYLDDKIQIDVHIIVVSQIIGAIDIYLIAVVLILFSFGLYELFISRIEAAENSENYALLQIHSLDALKDKIAQVIIMALIVKYFQMILDMTFNTSLDMLYLALSIFALALALYFLHTIKK